jgi:hypothetical protein
VEVGVGVTMKEGDKRKNKMDGGRKRKKERKREK